MHSRIFVVGNENSEIPTEEELFEMRPDNCIDYIMSSNLENDIVWLEDYFQKKFIDKKLNLSEEELKEEINKRVEKIKELAKKIENATIEDLVRDPNLFFYHLQNELQGEPLEFYIYDCEEMIFETLQNYLEMKYRLDKKVDTTILSSFDYHY